MLAVAALAGCGGGKETPHHGGVGSLYGTVTRGPTSPVCRAGTPCSEPASGVQLVFAQNGRVAARAVVANNGSYTVSLEPGTYAVTVSGQPSIGRGIEPSTVRVVAGSRQARDFSIDTGIR